MKTLRFLILMMITGMLLFGCGTKEEESSSDSSSGGALQINETRSAQIVNEVDDQGNTQDPDVHLYHINIDHAQTYLRVLCTETTASEVDLLVVAYNGRPRSGSNSNRIFGVQKDEDSTQAAEIDFLIPIADVTSDTIYITVRDLMDNDKHRTQTQAYRLTCSYVDTFGGPGNVQSLNELQLDMPVNEAISSVREVDGFSFAPAENGVYKFVITPPGSDSPIQLASRLYDALGSRLQRVNAPATTILAYLTTANGPYLLTAEDADSMDADEGGVYTVSVTQVDPDDGSDLLGNDTPETATALVAAGDLFTATGAIDYSCSSNLPDNAGDKDWYQFSVGSQAGAFNQVQMTMDNNGENAPAIIRATVYADPQGPPLMSHQFHTAGDMYEPFQNQFRAQTGTYYLLVEDVSVVAGASYIVTLQEAGITADSDTYEATDDNTINTARELPLAAADPTMISYVGDVDWYSITVDRTVPQILSAYLDSAASEVDYELIICVDGTCETPLKRTVDLVGDDGETHLKTSIFVPASTTETSSVFYIKVADAQSNDGSAEAYQISAQADDIPVAINSCAGAPAGPFYYNETNEQNRSAGTYSAVGEELQIDIYSGYTPSFIVNTNRLNYLDATSGAVIDGNTITFPWVGGYVDYQGDHDIFKVDFTPLTADETWYFDVKVELEVPCGSGSHVEYIWKLYQDGNGDATANNRVIDYPPGRDEEGNAYNTDGYKACAGDITPSDENASAPYNVSQTVSIVTPDTGERDFYIPSEDSRGVAADNDAQFFLSISDMVFQKLPDEDNNNNRSQLEDVPWKDDDWGYDGSPYFFRVTLTYHPGEARP